MPLCGRRRPGPWRVVARPLKLLSISPYFASNPGEARQPNHSSAGPTCRDQCPRLANICTACSIGRGDIAHDDEAWDQARHHHLFSFVLAQQFRVAFSLTLKSRLAERTGKFQNWRSGLPLDPGSVRSVKSQIRQIRFLRPIWRTTWRHSRDHKGYWFPRELRHSAALHWRRCWPGTSLPSRVRALPPWTRRCHSRPGFSGLPHAGRDRRAEHDASPWRRPKCHAPR